MEHSQAHIISRIIGKDKAGSKAVRLHGYVTAQRGKWEETSVLIDEKYSEMFLFVSQVLEVGMSELWDMNYFEFLRILNKADEISQQRLKQIEKSKSK